MCCGQKRAELRNNLAATRTPSSFPAAPNNAPASYLRSQPYAPSRSVDRTAAVHSPNQVLSQASVMLLYVEQSPIRVQGRQTGRYYEFSGKRPVQAVDARDASSLLGTRFFRRA